MWIWADRSDDTTYNDTIIAVRTFYVKKLESAQIRITADSRYRLFVNGHWVADGPARAWPEHYSYDVFDIFPLLHHGDNEVKTVARYFGCGTFHSVPQQAGLLAEIKLGLPGGTHEFIHTDRSWKIADGLPWKRNTPKISIQMEPAEVYDASFEKGIVYGDAIELFPSAGGPWKELHERSVAYLRRRERPLKRFLGANLLADPPLTFSMAHTRLMNPGLIEANGRVFSPFGIATELVMTASGQISFAASTIDRGHFKIAVDGQIVENDTPIPLCKGRHFILGFARNILNNDKTISISLNHPDQFLLQNPLSSGYANPWCYIPMQEYAFVQNDMTWRWFAGPLSEGKDHAFEQVTEAFLSSISSADEFRAQWHGKAENIPCNTMFVEDPYVDFVNRGVIRQISEKIGDPDALIRDDNTSTIIPPQGHAIELIYDLGEQNCGYVHFDLTADEGVVIDVFLVEYISPDGRVQFTANNRNGFRHVTKQGENRYTSMKRRSGRYLFMTLRNVDREVAIRNIHLVESTYPVTETEVFSCSDERLNKITEICARTLTLCMEDVYTDCPLYEQTLWVGDLRNEALYGYYAFGATDIARSSLLLAAESTGRYGMIAAQVPSCWDMILPAWSFLWGIAVWEYYWYTGDKAFLEILYPYVQKNIESAAKLLAENGLFSAPYWNFFDWAKIDQEHTTVLHNSMLFVGALRCAILCAEHLNDPVGAARFQALMTKLIDSINRYWDVNRNSFPDSIHNDGTISASSSQHTSFLALLFDILAPQNADAAIRNLLNPPDEMVRVGSPFTIMYLYEALEKHGHANFLLRSIVDAYTPMVESDATTVWESYPHGSLAHDGFPTRSHCHGWSASPMYFFVRVILGLRQTGVGCTSFEISPTLFGLRYARGTIKTPYGDISVAWKCEGTQLSIKCSCPAEIDIAYQTNETLKGCTVDFFKEDISPGKAKY